MTTAPGQQPTDLVAVVPLLTCQNLVGGRLLTSICNMHVERFLVGQLL
ncbi:hypothetical protein FLM9_301 [Candidatus Synechococcus spongiarum]|uniref:Uncharacterized protein n=1 Tax=Candidatus Synechococcus spongiarum TaxID=431041 RepID=A0A161KA48_9SYNE|nr:hypothetical protein FLM9_301 [Candidatus Synechococcus spongiarum]